MDRRQFTVKPSKGLKNFVNKGTYFELEQSRFWHQKGIPLLVSADILRTRSMGQVDLAVITQMQIIVIECKSSIVGVEGTQLSRQYHRLKNSADFIAKIFNKNILLKWSY